MWALIIVSHFLMFISFSMLLFSAITGHFLIDDLDTLSLKYFSIYAIIVYVFTQSLILFLIITINKSIKNLVNENNLKIEDQLYSKYKFKMHMHTSLNLLFMTIIAILYGAVHTGLMSELIHNIIFCIILSHYLYNIIIQYQCFKRIIKLIVRVNDMIVSKL